jgi:hypothetical protein
MVVGKTFAWGHMGKTGGDATFALFQCVPDLIEWAHPITDPDKHRNFESLGVVRDTYALNIRRLPSLVLSYVHHAKRYGLDATLPKGTRLSPDEASRFDRPERMIRNHTARGRITIDRWLRMESLREDFLDLAWTLRPLSGDEEAAIRHVATKPPMDYDHDVFAFFSADQIDSLYRSNPTWAHFEREVYGSLLRPDAERSAGTSRTDDLTRVLESSE